ncbi:MAG: CoB--CoM heterodisulfide reductase iron-sulfur subunit B family protein [Chloroflexi bacterium]|nr:CoB--CoM heterodisulfide reductase iron-sulfur subunit B family protein [Chloroflexota bacterium]
MTATYAYYPGCSLDTSAKEYDISIRRVCRLLGIELRPLEGWTCCGSSAAHATSQLLAISLAARNLQLATKENLPITTPCPSCFARLKTASLALEDETTAAAVQEVLEKSLGSSVAVEHLVAVLSDPGLALPVKRPLAGLKVASYYGCLLVRPPDVSPLDDPENPQFMDRLMERLGAEAVDWPFKSECCGASLIFPRPDLTLSLSHRVLTAAMKRGADCVVVACPLCHSNLDIRQREMTARFGGKLGLPVLYFSQLMGLALGIEARELGLERHLVDPLPMLRAKGLA